MTDKPIATITVAAPFEDDDWVMEMDAKFELSDDGQIVCDRLDLSRNGYTLALTDCARLHAQAQDYAECLLGQVAEACRVANPMSAREAWRVVLCGDPSHDRWARAHAIVEALVHAHEGLGESSDYDVPIRTAKVRALERGDEIPRVTTRKERGA